MIRSLRPATELEAAQPDVRGRYYQSKNADDRAVSEELHEADGVTAGAGEVDDDDVGRGAQDSGMADLGGNDCRDAADVGCEYLSQEKWRGILAHPVYDCVVGDIGDGFGNALKLTLHTRNHSSLFSLFEFDLI